MKLKACSLVYSSQLSAQDFPGLGDMRPRFLLPFAGRFTYLDMFLSPLVRAGVRNHLVVTQRHAETAHTYLESAWGDEGFKVLPFLPESGDVPFDAQMYSVFKSELSPYVFFGQVDHPCWFDMAELASEMRMRVRGVQPVFGRKAAGVILVERGELLDVLSQMVKKAVPAARVLEKAFQILVKGDRVKQVPVEGYYLQVNSLQEYISANLAILQQQEQFRTLFARVPLQSGLSGKAQATIESTASFYRSSLADRCVVRGNIHDSVLFPGVEIGKNTEVRDSVILPGVRIGDNVRIARCMIDAAGDLPQNVKVQIADGVRIGNAKSRLENRDHAAALNDGFTFIGGGTVIPRGVTIGAGCHVGAGTPKTVFSRHKTLADGRSLAR